MIPSPYCTIGPFFPGQFAEDCSDLTQFDGKTARGERIVISGRVLEEGNVPVRNAIVEIWQPDANGVFRHPLDPRAETADPGFFGWGRARTDAEGRYVFHSVLPGRYSENGVLRVPHVNLMVLAIGLTRRLVTTAFFGDPSAASPDPVLRAISDPAVRSRMFTTLEGPGSYRFDLVLRGPKETPFFLD